MRDLRKDLSILRMPRFAYHCSVLGYESTISLILTSVDCENDLFTSCEGLLASFGSGKSLVRHADF